MKGGGRERPRGGGRSDGGRAAARAFPILGALLALSPASVRADEAAPPPVKLDQLLKLPSSMEYDLERKGGATRTEWKERFKTAQSDVAAAKKSYDTAMGKLEKAAEGADSWRFVPPGGDVTAENQDNIRIRQEVGKKREELGRAEKRLKDLEVEADLASVPQDWRQ